MHRQSPAGASVVILYPCGIMQSGRPTPAVCCSPDRVTAGDFSPIMDTLRNIAGRMLRTGGFGLFALACAVSPTAVQAADLTCRAAAASAEQRYGLPPGLLLAIGKVESGETDPRTGTLEPWPWSVDWQGQGLSLPTKAASIAWVKALQAGDDPSVDVGCFQINLHYHPDAFSDLDEAFDPARNADAAARFLVQLHAQLGDWGLATGAYHSQTASLAAPYRRRVASAVDDAPIAPTPTPDPTLTLLHGAWQATLSGNGDTGPPAATRIAARATAPSPAMLAHLPIQPTIRAAPPSNLRDIIWRQH